MVIAGWGGRKETWEQSGCSVLPLVRFIGVFVPHLMGRFSSFRVPLGELFGQDCVRESRDAGAMCALKAEL